MSYLDNFVVALRFLTRFNKEFKKNHQDFGEIKSSLSTFWGMRDDEMYQNMNCVIAQLASYYLRNMQMEHVINRCHAVSQGFWDVLQRQEFSNAFSSNITIGNVFYKDKNIYNLSKSKLKCIINEGPSLEKSLDVHVWITFENMTVFDLTIMPTLFHRGLISEEELKNNPVLIWREDIESDFNYTPLLVDNEFMHRVDRVITA